MSKRAIFEEVAQKPSPGASPAPGAASAEKSASRRAVRLWLISLAGLIALMVLIGGLTRMTDSGLSITEWAPVMGAIPPLSAEDWDTAFKAYQTTDEFRIQNHWMTLADFKPIYWWEWSHRFLGRLIGLVWLFPLIWFAARKRIPRGWGARLVLPGLLGGLQGAVGWWMVWSGLSERVDVAPYRLMVHLGLAFLIFALILWYVYQLSREEWALLQARRARSKPVFAWAGAATGAIFLQILLGALVAGTDGWAGWNTWPLMDGAVITPDAFALTPYWSNFFENPAMTQFLHRSWAFVAFFAVLAFALKARRGAHGASRKWAMTLLAGTVAQAVLGIATLILAAPLELAAAHQIAALALLALAMRAKFEAAYPSQQRLRA